MVTGFLVLLTSMTLNDLKLSKEWILAHFSQFVAAAHISKVNCDKIAIEINQDYVPAGTAKAVPRLMSFAQITCNILT